MLFLFFLPLNTAYFHQAPCPSSKYTSNSLCFLQREFMVIFIILHRNSTIGFYQNQSTKKPPLKKELRFLNLLLYY